MKELLIVIDMQNDFLTGTKGIPEAQQILPAVNKKIEQAERVIYTLDTHTKELLSTQEGKNNSVEHCMKGTWGHALAEGLLQRKDALRIEKPTFGSIELGQTVKKLFESGEIDSVELVGVCTDVCVITNALLIKTFSPQLPVSVDASCCAGVTPQAHQTALAAMRACEVMIR